MPETKITIDVSNKDGALFVKLREKLILAINQFLDSAIIYQETTAKDQNTEKITFIASNFAREKLEKVGVENQKIIEEIEANYSLAQKNLVEANKINIESNFMASVYKLKLSLALSKVMIAGNDDKELHVLNKQIDALLDAAQNIGKNKSRDDYQEIEEYIKKLPESYNTDEITQDESKEDALLDTIGPSLRQSREKQLKAKEVSLTIPKKSFIEEGNLFQTLTQVTAEMDLLKTKLEDCINELEDIKRDNVKFKDVIYQNASSYGSKQQKQLMPINIYLDTDDPESTYAAYQAVIDFQTSIGFEILLDFRPESGSWIKKLISTSKDVITSEDVTSRLKEAEYGIEVNTILRQQSEIDKNQSEALLNILKSVENISNAAIRIGSLLVVKTTNADGDVNVQVRSLSIKELHLLNKKPELLIKPKYVLIALTKELNNGFDD